MPVRTINRYTCPITGTIEYADELPLGWFRVQDEVFSPGAKIPLAQLIMANPEVGFTEMMERLAGHTDPDVPAP